MTAITTAASVCRFTRRIEPTPHTSSPSVATCTRLIVTTPPISSHESVLVLTLSNTNAGASR